MLRTRPQYEDLTDAIVWAFVLGQLGINLLAGVKSRKGKVGGDVGCGPDKRKGASGQKGGSAKGGGEGAGGSKGGGAKGSGEECVGGGSSTSKDDTNHGFDGDGCPDTDKLTNQVVPPTQPVAARLMRNLSTPVSFGFFTSGF